MGKYVVIDLEMCRVPRAVYKEYRFKQEIIQIGAVLLDGTRIVDTFDTYVKPQYGELDPFIINLTGIKETHLADAPMLEAALDSFLNWFPEDAILVSWSDSDKIQFDKELKAKKLVNEKLDNILKRWEDCQKLFGQKISREKQFNLTEALVISNIDYKDQAHNGLVDAYNTALLFTKIQTESVFTYNKYYVDSKYNNSLKSSLADLVPGLKDIVLAE